MTKHHGQPVEIAGAAAHEQERAEGEGVRRQHPLQVRTGDA
jgi:hypothetical protein